MRLDAGARQQAERLGVAAGLNQDRQVEREDVMDGRIQPRQDAMQATERSRTPQNARSGSHIEHCLLLGQITAADIHQFADDTNERPLLL